MKALERISLLDKIGRALQAKMGYSDIALYLESHGINTSKPTSDVNSKWIYSKELLSDASESTLLNIATELEIPHGYVVNNKIATEDSKFWIPGYFRLFLSHISKEKIKATVLKSALKEYAISCFVAHEDIEPAFEWQSEIEKALFSMDALAACITPGFHESNWTDQEVGFALGRSVLVIPLRIGLDPYGFMGKVQGIQSKGKKASEIANLLFKSLSNHSSTRNRIANILVDQVLTTSDSDIGLKYIGYLSEIPELPLSHLERLRDNLNANAFLCIDSTFVNKLNKLLKARELPTFKGSTAGAEDLDDIPF